MVTASVHNLAFFYARREWYILIMRHKEAVCGGIFSNFASPEWNNLFVSDLNIERLRYMCVDGTCNVVVLVFSPFSLSAGEVI